MREIALRNRKKEIVAVTIVDDEDYDRLSEQSWYLHGTGYVSSTHRGKFSLMQRMVLGLVPGDGKIADHINRDKLDNRRSNLRVAADFFESAQNRDRPPGKYSRFRGVTKRCGRWTAMATINGHQTYLGTFETEESAAEAAANYRALHMPFSPEALALKNNGTATRLESAAVPSTNGG